MRQFLNRLFARIANEVKPHAGADRSADTRRAGEHYRRGNRLYEARSWEQARAEWHRATALWHAHSPARNALARRLAGLRAVLALLATVCAIYLLLLTFYPRGPFDMLASGMAYQDSGSWWERFLDTGRPGLQGSHKMGVREWWERLKRRLGQDEGELAEGARFRPTIDRRWAELLRRYGRWGLLTGSELDYHVVAGTGLSGLGRFEEAVTVLRQGIAATRDGERLGELYQGLANAYYFEGYGLEENGLARYDMDLVRQSAEAYEKTLQYRPRLLALGNLGWVYYLLGRYDRAESYSLRALSYDPDLNYVRLNLGLIYLVQGRLRESYAAYRRVAARHPQGEAFLGGMNDLKEVLRDHPGRYPFAHLMIGFLALQTGDRPTARQHLQTFLTHPAVRERWRNLGRRWMEDPTSATEF